MEWVYIIWHWWANPHVVRVWQGIIKERLSEHRENVDILKYKNSWLYVTWAYVDSQHRDGVERYLWESKTSGVREIPWSCPYKG